MKSTSAIVLALLLVVSTHAQGQGSTPSTAAPTAAPSSAGPSTAAPSTAAPSTAAPSTAAPTAAPSTAAPSTAAPTAAPSTADPSTAAPSTAAPSTAAPSTAAPSTAAPSTAAPSTAAPSTSAPSTAGPTTAAPSTAGPTTAAPSTAGPTTAAPSTAGPTTAAPSTAGPTTAAPSTAGPSTAAPSTAGPSTAAPSTAAPIETTTSPNEDGYCFNGGTSSCHCPPGYTGKRCESYVNWCDGTTIYEEGDQSTVQLCGPHGDCHFNDSRGSFCVCKAGWTGQFCDSPIANQTFISTRCHYHYGASNPNPDCTHGAERCLPDRLNCAFQPCSEPDNIGWCVPLATHQTIMTAFLNQPTRYNRHL